MSCYDEIEHESLECEALQDLLDNDELFRSWKGIAKIVIDQGEHALIGKQVNVYRSLKRKFFELYCSACTREIDISEVPYSRHNHGRCMRCGTRIPEFDVN